MSRKGSRKPQSDRESIQRTARAVGLRNFTTPTLEAVERRRLQLWATTLLLLVLTCLVLALVTLDIMGPLPEWARPTLIQGALVVLVVLFSFYAIEKELQLKRLTELLVRERVLTASLMSRIREISTLLEAGKAINLNLDLREVLETLMRCTYDLLDCRDASVLLVHADRQLRRAFGDPSATVRFGEGVAGRVADSGEPLLLEGTRGKPQSDKHDPDMPSASMMCVPLVHRDKLLGVLCVEAADDRVYTQHDLRALSLFGEQAAAAIANSQLYEEQRLTASRSAYQALHDPLTSLPNRMLFLDRVDVALTRRRGDDERVALLYLDLDDFKRINDVHGHFAGDEVLIEFARRIRSAIRASDTVARLGGDEFAVLQEDTRSIDDTLATARRIHYSTSQPYIVSTEAKPLELAVTIGIAMAESGDSSTADMVRNANTAMRIAKRQSKGSMCVFEPNMQVDVLHFSDLERDIVGAAERGELEVCYQPVFDLQERDIVAVEALARWNHPERGQLTAATFINIAEQSGALASVDRWVTEQACRAVQAINEAKPDSAPLSLHLNLVPTRMRDSRVVDEIEGALKSSGLAPRLLVLEITENAALTASYDANSTLHGIAALGARLALDDFGTGYSSLAYLSRVPIDTVKIDRTFVAGLAQHSGEGELVRAIIKLGLSLNLHVIAEGVERRAQLAALTAIGCPLGQGNLLAPPLALDDLKKLLAERMTSADHAESGETSIPEYNASNN